MNGIRGNDQFNGRFDFFEWSAPYYLTPKDVIRALEAIDYKGKKVKSINVIGYVTNVGRNNNNLLYWTIKHAGVEMKDNWWESYPFLDQVMLPWEAETCEPIQFVFEDNSTMEILPIGDGGARIGVNTIPADLSEGLNHSNFDANIFYSEALGKTIRGIEMRVEKTTKQYVNKYSIDAEKPHVETRTHYRFRIDFDASIEMELDQSWESWYWVKMRGFGWNEDKVPFSRIKASEKHTDQIPIINGRDGGGVFWIVPISSNSDKEPEHFFVDNYGIAIDEGDVSTYLGAFLYQHFDPAVQEDDEDYYGGERSFDSYGSNLYTFDSIKVILREIAETIILLENDYNNPALSRVRDNLPWYRYTTKNRNDLSEEEINALRRLGVPVAVDFYKRFTKRMEAMMKLPGRDIMSFAGP